MELVTGYAGKAHITAVQNGALNAGIVGSGSYVFNTGEKLSASVITNNLIRIHDGDIIANGRHITIAKGTYEEVEIANGLQGVKRNDLICARYEKNADSGIESASLVVIQGTSTEGTPDDPEYNDNNILDGTLISDFPLYRITLDGLNVSEPEQLFTVVKGINELQEEVADILEQTNSVLFNVYENSSKQIITTLENYKLALIQKTINLPKGTYSVKVFGEICSSTGHAVDLRIIGSSLGIIGRCMTNNTTSMAYASENILEVTEDIIDEVITLQLTGNTKSTCTLESYSIYGGSIIRLK